MMRLAPRAKAVVGGNAVKRHKADVVAVAGIVSPRIAQTNEKFHAAPRRSSFVSLALGRQKDKRAAIACRPLEPFA